MLFPVHYLIKEHISSFKNQICLFSRFLGDQKYSHRKFALCDGTLIVAMVTLQEPYFPKHVFSYINLENLVLFLEYAGIFVTDRTRYENVL